MRRPLKFRFAIAALTALITAAPAAAKNDNPGAASSEVRAYFHDWLAICARGGTACRAAAFSGAGAGAAPGYQLVMFSPAAGAPYRMEFVPDSHFPDARTVIDLDIDRHRIASLPPGNWARRAGGAAHEYALAPEIANTALATAMKSGARLRIVYDDRGGAERWVTFSLFGLTDALAWMDAQRGGHP